MHRCGFLKACSQMRTTRHPCLRSVRLTSRSRALLAAIFFDQKTRLLTGRFECLGQPCQKQPSTKTATFCFGKTKSGLPKNGRWRRQPVMLCWRKILMRASSVSLLPCPRMWDMTSERLALVKTSGTDYAWKLVKKPRCGSSGVPTRSARSNNRLPSSHDVSGSRQHP